MEPVIRVLLIEDDEDDYVLTRSLLSESKDTKFRLDWVSSYAEAVDAIEGAQHAVYLVDHNLGPDDGLELVKRYSAGPVPMIMLTGQEGREIDLEAMRSGAIDYLVKGQINAALLERSIRYSIERKRTEEALRRKDEFLAMLSHELRNPLAPIRTALHILEMPQVDEEHARHAKEVIKRQMEHLVRLVDELLDISRIMHGRIELRKQPVDLVDVVKHAIETAQPAIDARGHQISVTFPAGRVVIEADAVRLSQAIGNLLINAAKYTEKAGRIWIEAGREKDDAVIRVRDSGAGIEPELLPQIFDLFVQGQRSLARSQGGLGIGLTLVKRLAELHGGTVTASSAGLGRGSEFVVRIPALHSPSDAESPPIPGESQRSSRHVLVVDDNVDAAECVGVMLELQGHQVQVAHDGFEAVEAARRDKPDVILLDIGLPGRDGYEVAEILRADPQFAQTKIIAVTGYGKDEDRQRSKAAGMDHHLTKPVAPEDLDHLMGTFAKA
jgi:two-component system CheB/CheR fusion protein